MRGHGAAVPSRRACAAAAGVPRSRDMQSGASWRARSATPPSVVKQAGAVPTTAKGRRTGKHAQLRCDGACGVHVQRSSTARGCVRGCWKRDSQYRGHLENPHVQGVRGNGSRVRQRRATRTRNTAEWSADLCSVVTKKTKACRGGVTHEKFLWSNSRLSTHVGAVAVSFSVSCTA